MKFRFFILLFFFSSVFICAQQQTDSTLFNKAKGTAIADSLNTAKQDTSAKKKSDIDAIIYTSGSDSLVFRVDQRKLEIYGNGELKYKKTELKSANIAVDFNLNQIQASGVVDTSDTAKVKIKGTPVMSEAGEIYEGNKLTYNFKTQRGLISGAKNKADGGIYGGDKVKKIAPNAYFIKDGTYTTCEADTSHYFFYSKEMKVVMNEQIIARWIWLYIGGVPLPIPLPFGVFPNQSGRRSGIIAPAYGQSAAWGQYFSHLGYFWAINDYMDANITGNIYFRGGYTLESYMRYVKRYDLNGDVNLGYTHLSGQAKNWRIALHHNQSLTPTSRIDANLSFISSFDYVANTGFGRNDILGNQTVTSSASYYKNWDESGNTLTLGYQRTQSFLGAKSTTDEVLPSVYFTKSQAYPFRPKGSLYDQRNSKWYQDIYYTYSGRLENRRHSDDSTSKTNPGIQHLISVNASPKLGYFSVTPFLSYTENWYDKLLEINEVRSEKDSKYSLVRKEINKLSAVRFFSLGVGASTNLYGIVQPRALGIEAIRHVIRPTLSYTYTPDFSRSVWGYYGTYLDSNGVQQKYNKYENSIFGGAPSTESQSIGLSISNNIEMKTMKDPSDTTSEAKKIQILSFQLSSAYNLAAGVQKRLSNLALSYHTQISDILGLSGSSNYSFYDFDYSKGYESNRFLASRDGGGLMRLLNFNLSAQISLSAEKFKASGKKQPSASDNAQKSYSSVNRNVRSELTGQYNDESPDYTIPWDLSLNINYSMDKSNPERQTSSTNMGGNLNFNLTPSLKMSMTSNYDFKTHQLVYPEIRIFKDLHCWEMNFTWNPVGTYSGYRFEIRIKASQLRDIKLERSYGQYSGR
ncbi:MAG: putative LPS assembly protein LptD [Bacteroidota bacterium]|nr:putative LPS assembly protein LptD [Bacteroidota bacterium]